MLADMDTLLRALEASPSEVDTYLVYADQLQAEGDPRGELIAYHHALRLDPSNRAAEKRAGLLIDAHRKEWLGAGAERGASELHVSWFMGFPERVHLKLGSIAASARLLDRMLAGDAYRLVQRLIIEVSEAVFDAGAFADLLLARGRPVGLRELRIGPPGRARLPEALLARFPRLRERPELGWTELREAIATQKRLKTGFEQATLPGLTLIDPGLGLEVVSHELVLGLRAEIDKQRALGVLEAMRRLFTPGSLDHFALALMRGWEESGAPSAQRWVLDVAGALGSDQCAAYLASRLGSWSRQRAVKATDVLVELGAPMGLNEIYQLSWHEGSRSEHAAKTLARMAKNRRVPLAGLLDRAVPSQPDAETTRRFLAIQTRWFSDLMINGHRLSRSDFLHYVAAGPRRALASRLVWGVFRGASCIASVGVDDEGKLFDSEGRAARIPGDTKLGLLHPMEIEPGTRRAWLERFAQRGLHQPFAQLRRPRLRLRENERGAKTLFRFRDRLAVAPVSSWEGGRWIRWQSYDIENDRTHYGYELRLARGGSKMSCVAVYSGEEIVRVFNRERKRFGELDPILVSELLCELEGLTSRPYAQLDLRLELRERSSGTCLACGRPFERGQLSLGLLRPALVGDPRRAWAHWSCAEELPELQLGLEHADVSGDLRELLSGFGPVPDGALRGPEARPTLAPKSGGSGSGQALDEDAVLARCPDAKAVAASKKTAAISNWSELGRAGELAWGVCTGGRRYQVAVDLGRALVHCECPSRKRPCKHGVALMLLCARGEVEEGELPASIRARF